MDGAAYPHGFDLNSAAPAVAAAEVPLDGASTAGGFDQKPLARHPDGSIDLGQDRDQKPETAVAAEGAAGVEGIGDGVVEMKQSMDSVAVAVEETPVKGPTLDTRIMGDGGSEAAEMNDKGGEGVASGSELMASIASLSSEMKAMGEGSEAADMKDKGGDGSASESELMMNQCMDAEATGDGVAAERKDKGCSGGSSESELVMQVPVVEAQSDEARLISSDAMNRKDSVIAKEGVASLVVSQSTKPEEIVMTADSVQHSADGDHKRQVGEPEPLEEVKETVERVTVRPHAFTAEDEQRARYYLSLPGEKAAVSVPDLVWGKVRSHPWWPGEIFDPSHASDLALKHQKEDKLLIAYFGDRTFVWIDDSQLKPFYTHFAQMEKQSNMEVFRIAVNAALEEVTRRVVVGMTCSCFADKAYAAMKDKKVVNTGIREGTFSSMVDRSLIVKSFEPERLLEYVKALAEYPSGGADKLELVTAKAQLKAFYRSKGYHELPVFLSGGSLIESDSEISGGSLIENNSETSSSKLKKSSKGNIDHLASIPSDVGSGKRKTRGRGSSSNRHKHILESGRKQRKLSELMEERDVSHSANVRRSRSRQRAVSVSSANKRKAVNFATPDLDKGKKKRLDSLGDIGVKTPSPRSAKVGERISRIASQLSRSPPIMKSNDKTKSGAKASRRRGGDVDVGDTTRASAVTCRIKKGVAKAYCSPSEVLSQLCLAARDPMKEYSFLPAMITFLSDFRVSISSKDKEHAQTAGGRSDRRKSADALSAAEEAATSNYMPDSYWSDVIFHDDPEKPSSSVHKRKEKSQSKGRKKMTLSDEVPSTTLPLDTVLDPAEDLQVGLVSPCTQQELTEERQMNYSGEKTGDDYAPAALILSFTESDNLPSVADLINIFTRFGPLEEAQTEVLKEGNRAEVVFQKRTDAETAYNNAGKCSFFGPALVSYRLKYLPSTPKASPDAKQEEEKDALPDELKASRCLSSV